MHHEDVASSLRFVQVDITKTLVHKCEQACEHFRELALLLAFALNSSYIIPAGHDMDIFAIMSIGMQREDSLHHVLQIIKDAMQIFTGKRGWRKRLLRGYGQQGKSTFMFMFIIRPCKRIHESLSPPCYCKMLLITAFVDGGAFSPVMGQDSSNSLKRYWKNM